MQEAWKGLIAVMQHSRAGMARVRDAGAADALTDLAMSDRVQRNVLQDCALQGLAVLFGDHTQPSILRPELVSHLVSIVQSPDYSSNAVVGSALLLLKRATSTPDGCRQIIDSGGITALLGVLKSRAWPELIAQAAAAVAGLTASYAITRAAGAVDALAAVLRHPNADPAHKSAALDALSDLLRYRPDLAPELRAGNAPEAMAEEIYWDDAKSQRAQCARIALCHFAAVSLENAKAVFRGRGVPALVTVLVQGPEDSDRCVAAGGCTPVYGGPREAYCRRRAAGGGGYGKSLSAESYKRSPPATACAADSASEER